MYRTRKVSSGGYYPPREVVIEFAWKAQVAWHGGPEQGTPMYCGGTMVFDASGNVLHYVLKGDSEQRRRRLVEYWKYQAEQEADDDAAGFAGKGRRSCFTQRG